MSVRSSSSLGEACGGAVVRSGYYKKLKTSRKKYFVLRAETPDSSARLEYYDSEKKFNSGQPPKRSIPLRSCFNINKQVDTKHKHVIALYTKDDRFCIVLESEDEQDAWLKALLSLQHGEDAADGEPPRPTFEHVWQVTLLKRGLGSSYAKVPEASVYRLCLTDKVLSLIRKDEPQIELSLSSIRSCGSLKSYFYLEVGRSSTIGAGDLWMETEDANIAHNVHQTVFHAMTTTSNSKEELGPKSRNRSSSATESSKPANMIRRQPSAGVPKPIPYVQDTTNTTSSPNTGETQVPGGTVTSHATGFSGGRERCDSMPSRPRTTSEGGNHIMPLLGQNRPYLLPHRPQSLYTKDFSPSGSPVSPPSAAGSTDSAGSSLSIDDVEPWPEVEMLSRYPHSLTPDEPIVEENCEDCADGPYLTHVAAAASPYTNSYVPMGGHASSDDGYVNMHPIVSPAASTSSVTSGTPSTDMRFPEYPLEKVPSYFTPSEEDETSSADRPIRAYSFGSRPENGKTRSSHACDAIRERAFSFGAKTKKFHSRILPPHGAASHSHAGPKSSSAPLLLGSRMHGSHGSLGARDPMNDLMEMDFTKKTSGYMEMNNRAGRTPPGYVEMKPGNVDCDRAKPHFASGAEQHRNQGRTQDSSPYVDMRPGTSPSRPLHENSSNWNRFGGKEQTPSGYMDMDLRKNKTEKPVVRSATSPLLPSPLSQQTPAPNDYMYMTKPGDYVEMKPGRVLSKENLYKSIDVAFNARKATTKPTQPIDSQQQSPGKYWFQPKSYDGSPSSIEYIDVDYPSDVRTNSDVKNHPESYVEMTPGYQSLSRKSSAAAAAKPVASDYTNMSVGKKKDRKHKKDKNRSQPIQIQTSAASQFPKNTSPNSPLFSFLTRKLSTETPPKMHLPLSNSGYDLFSSLPRQRTRKNSRRDSKESSSSSVTTPSSSSTIFPISLNSPSSPIKPQQNQPTDNVKLPPSVLSAKYSPSSYDGDDYTVMDFEKPKAAANDSDYVNYNPGFQVLRAANTDFDDYALMKPNASTKIAKVNSVASPTSASSVLVSPLSCVNLGESKCFRPISESNETGATSPRCSLVPNKSLENLKTVDLINESPGCGGEATKDSRPSSVNSDKVTVSRPSSVSFDKSRPGSVSSETTISSLSRPSSTSSEMGSTTSTVVPSRPSSVNSDNTKTTASGPTEGQLYYASLDLVRSVEEDGSRSPRTVKTQTAAGNEGGSCATTSSQDQPQPGFMYAKIDFVKSEGFKHSPLPNNAKVKP